MTTAKDELRRMAIETAYSSKGHFKTADWINLSLTAYVSVPTITSLIMAFFKVPDFWVRSLSFLGLLFSIFALGSVLATNRDRALREINEHHDLGNRYLALHKEIRIRLADPPSITQQVLIDFQDRVSALDTSGPKYKISFIGRWWAKIRIYSEMDLHWVDDI